MLSGFRAIAYTIRRTIGPNSLLTSSNEKSSVYCFLSTGSVKVPETILKEALETNCDRLVSMFCEFGHVGSKFVPSIIKKGLIHSLTLVTHLVDSSDAFWYACQSGSTRMVQLFIQKVEYRHILSAIRRGNENVVQVLLQHKDCCVIFENHDYIKEIITTGTATTLKLLLEDGRFDPTRRDNEYIRLAVKMRQEGMVQELICDGRSDPSALQNETFMLLVELNLLTSFDLLMSYE
jgi:hypothetical protein